ncbi:LysR family transcriptional regulator [Photobacterium profundum]|uniref:Transcriptional regulatory protein, LysR family protein n=1 Tax=Photobacterium profundum 3TCK TaxID=314280 RepID=Q1YZ71_9GAMM|nr:LysR family transcriptional regulator [Photobacterium profundum]EAS41586.1 transcriptional regulatory protein, LysR family protein [Photobacterium profundum 3TCK]PSV64042.1 LysR family transcriptional regulator [Photobacterium profundum]
METNVNLRDLRAFCAVVDQGSITAAATALAETKGSVSRRISRLEEKLGTALIQRNSGRAQATPDGMAYRLRAVEALEILDMAQNELLDQHVTPQGHLRVTAVQGIANILNLGDCLGRFAEVYPKVSVDMIMTTDILSLQENQIDFAFRLASGDLPDSSHRALLLAKVGLGFAASPDYLEKNGTPQHPSELQNHRLLLPRTFGSGISISMQPITQPEKTDTFYLKGHITCQDTLFLADSALAGGGIALMSPSVQKPYINSGQLVPVLDGWESCQSGNLYLVFSGGPLSPKAKAFKEFIKAEFSHTPLI